MFDFVVFVKTKILCLINSICKIFLEVFIFDKQIRKILKAKLAKFYIKKYIKKASKLNVITTPPQKAKIIWQFWEQGIENAPDIVKACVNSVEKYKNGCEHKVLDIKTLKEYVEIPDFIYKLKEQKKMPAANFSDIVRTYLLAKYGGVWADATVLFTQDLPDYIINSNLFLLKNELKADVDGLNTANYFISCNSNSAFIQQMKYFVDEYWKNNKALYNYFFYIHGMTMLSILSKQAKEEFDNIPFMNFLPVQRFQEELLNEYSKERMNQIKSMAPFHKLTYKMNLIPKSKKEVKETFLDKLIKEEL